MPGGWGRDVAQWLQPLAAGDLLAFMSLGPVARRGVRSALSVALRDGSEQGPFLELCVLPQAAVEMALPCRIGDYTDFYTGIHHATAVGKLFRPDNPLLPNYQWVPIGYHGRASSIVPSGQRFQRPLGQVKGPNDATPRLAPTARLDHELELGFLIGRRQRAGRAGADREGGGRAVRHRAAQRLVGARRAGLGVPAARSVPVEELRVDDLALGGHARGAGAVPRTFRAARRRPAAAALPRLGGQPRRRRLRHHARGVACRRRACASRPAARQR
jgi:hypothetical protein